MDPKTQLEALKAFLDGETVCPPNLEGRPGALAEWSMDTLAALVAGKEIPNPETY